MELPSGGSPRLDLRLGWDGFDLARVRHYLPAAGIKEKLARWLNQALVSGRVSGGTLAVRGRLDDFPFDRGEGLFHARFPVRDAVLDYHSRWPRLEDARGEVVFHNRSLTVTAATGRLYGAPLERVDARIDDLQHAVLALRGRTRTAAETLLAFVRDSPLAARLEGYVAGMAATGDNVLDLDLTIPLGPAPVQVNGRLDFTGGGLTLSPAWGGLRFTDIRGGLYFSDKSLLARDVQLRLEKRPLRLDIDTVAAGESRETRFWLHGRLGAEAFPDWLAVPPGILRGDAQWEGLLAVTARPEGGPAGFQLSMTSDLAGMAVHLPPPLAKPAARRRAFAARAALTAPGALEVRAAYGNLARSVLLFAGVGDRPRLERGELRVRAGEAALPVSPGLHVT
ncbi:MAG: hypothetical protein M3Z21_04855, partial [Pseudomonadota bacterium]|nr:hypothetical protein [Pseudomonadota bacterium]